MTNGALQIPSFLRVSLSFRFKRGATAKQPPEATLRGHEFFFYDMAQSGGEPIVSSSDEVSLYFKTRQATGMLFYTGIGFLQFYFLDNTTSIHQRNWKSLFLSSSSSSLSGDGEDYLALTLRDGAVTLNINLGSGKLDVQIRPPRVRFDDNQWHRVNIHRKAQEVIERNKRNWPQCCNPLSAHVFPLIRKVPRFFLSYFLT